MLGDQGLEHTAENWLAVILHFLSLPLISPERHARTCCCPTRSDARRCHR